MNKIVKFFDKLEDKVRQYLSQFPIVYAIIGGIAIVFFWRGVWDFADELETLGGAWGFFFHPIISLFISMAVLLLTGLFVSFFIGDRIILAGLKHEKKVEEKTEAEVREEEAILKNINEKLNHLHREFEELKITLKK